MVSKKRGLIFVFAMLFLFALMVNVSAWELNGTTKDVNGSILNNTLVNVTVYDFRMNVKHSNWTYSNSSGKFNVSVTNGTGNFYKIKVKHFENNASSGVVDYVGQSLPAFPYKQFKNNFSADFRLQPAGTINLTAVNKTGSSKSFNYDVRDKKLGHSVASEFDSSVSQETIHVPRNRNYSITIYPNRSSPIGFEWENFSASSNYGFDYNSDYEADNHTLNKQFNLTENLLWVNGYAMNGSGEIPGYDEFNVVPFVFESGNMVFLGDNAAMPYNMSAWRPPSQTRTDSYNLGSGHYNITLPGHAENASYLLYATARKGSDYYGGFKNISLGVNDGNTQENFTMYPLMSNDSWGTVESNITMNDASDWSKINISTAKQDFNFVNSSDGSSMNVSASVEATVDYSNYNATEFTFVTNTDSKDSSFSLPLINKTGIKESNIYSNNFAPKSLSKRSPEEILNLGGNNISMKQFSPGDIQGKLNNSQISMELFTSNSTCDSPNPSSGCSVGDPTDVKNFNPLNAIIGGGDLSFRMGQNDILVHYVNVDLLASGPPDALFDDSTNEDTSSGFESALRFGSQGPEIYDHILVSTPYTEGSSSNTGLNESGQINMSIPALYLENSSGEIDWKDPVWNTSENGTSGSNLGGNYSHYSDASSDWGNLMKENVCINDSSKLNSTNPCYVNKSSDRIWIRLPHFSGTEPSISGDVVQASSSDDSSSSSSSNNPGGGRFSSGGLSEPSEIRSRVWNEINPGKAGVMKNFDSETGLKEISVEVNNPVKDVKITVNKYDGKPADVSVEKSGNVYQYLEIDGSQVKEDLDKATITAKAEKSWVENNSLSREDVAVSKFDENAEEWNELNTSFESEDDTYYYYNAEVESFSFFSIGEKESVETMESGSDQESGTGDGTSGEGGASDRGTEATQQGNSPWIWVVLGVLVLVVAAVVAVKNKK